MKFFSTIHGSTYPVARIRKIARSSPDEKTGFTPSGLIVLDGDVEVRATDSEIDRITAGDAPLIPAQPGFDQLIFWYNAGSEEEPWVSVRPIIAWRDTAEDGIIPVTTEDVKWIKAPMAVRVPDGRVMDWEAEWADQAEWAANMKQRADYEHAEQSSKAVPS